MIKNIIKATSCTLAILFFSPANAAFLSNPSGTNYTTIDQGSRFGLTNIVVDITSNGTFTLYFDSFGISSEDVYITLVNSTGSDWSSFSINYDDFVNPGFQATLAVLGTGSGNPAVISTVFTDPTYNLITGFEADFIGGESISVGVEGNLSYFTYALMPITISTSSVPVPAAAWLFGSGLIGLIGVARRKKA